MANNSRPTPNSPPIPRHPVPTYPNYPELKNDLNDFVKTLQDLYIADDLMREIEDYAGDIYEYDYDYDMMNTHFSPLE